MSEDNILRKSPELLNALLKDHTTSKGEEQCNIFWATSDYESLGEGFGYYDQISPECITGDNGNVIMPRVLKNRDTQRDRSRGMAEVFTPSWVCNAQNNLIDNAWFGREGVFNTENDDHTWTTNPDKITFPEGKTWQDYVRDTRLEITCGEAPYLVSRYDTTTGEMIPLENRIGLLDRKLRVVSENVDNSGEWLKWAQVAYKSTYGYEWQGDSLLLARENLLLTFIDYFYAKFLENPVLNILLDIAEIISWNVWQMDGQKAVIPGSCGDKPSNETELYDERKIVSCEGCRTGKINRHNGIYCRIQDWDNYSERGILFKDLINSRQPWI